MVNEVKWPIWEMKMKLLLQAESYFLPSHLLMTGIGDIFFSVSSPQGPTDSL